MKTRAGDASLLGAGVGGGGVWEHPPPENFEIYRLGNGIFNILNEIFLQKYSTWIRCKMTGTSSVWCLYQEAITLVIGSCMYLMREQKHFSPRKVGGSGATPGSSVPG